MTVDIKEKLYKDISNYCKVNHLVIKDYINDLLKKSFMIDKYGDRPGVSNNTVSNTPEIKKDVKVIEVADIKQSEPEVIDGGTIVEFVDEKKYEEPAIEDVKVEKTETINKEEEEPIVVKQPKKRKLK